MIFDLKKLQDGANIYGIADDSVAGEEVNLTQRDAGSIAMGFMVWLAQELDKPIFSMKICVGRDSRATSHSLVEGIMMGIQMTGSRSWYAGIATGPAMHQSTVMDFYEFDGAVIVTGGPHASNINGFKFYTANGQLGEDDIARILKMASKSSFIGEWYETEPVNLMDMYATRLRAMISNGLAGTDRAANGSGSKLDGMHIVVDAANGSGGFFVEKVLEKMGADCTGSMNLDPDGTFPSHLPDADNEEAITALSKAVIDNNADLGILFDAAVETATIVGSDGQILARSEAGSDGAAFAVDSIVKVAKNR